MAEREHEVADSEVLQTEGEEVENFYGLAGFQDHKAEVIWHIGA